MNTRRLVQALFLSILLTGGSALAEVKRSLDIAVPATIKRGMEINALVTADTGATDAEQIGFLHTEYSLDEGKTWVPVYAENLGRKATRAVNIPTSSGSAKVLVRVRAAFRGGKAGDVDFSGQPIVWDGSWAKWATPPSKSATINVAAR